jgi:hypothetical protein
VGPITALTWALEIGGLHPVLIDQAGHQLLRLVRRREELSRQGDADADFQAEEQAYPASADRGCQAGAQRVSRTRPDPRERTGEGKSEPRHVGACKEDGLLHARRRAQTAGLRACRGI